MPGTIVTVGGEKGGTGKTALATNIAVCFAVRGVDVVLVDADPQRSSGRWAERRRGVDESNTLARVHYQHLDCTEDDGRGFYDSLMDLKERYGVIVVDSGGADSVAFRTAVAACDMLLSPIVPSTCDIDTAGQVDEIVGQVRAMGRTELRAAFVLNQCSTHASDGEARDAIRELGEICKHMHVCSARVGHRKAFRTAYRACRSVVELVAHSDRSVRELARKSSDEIWALYAEVSGDRELADAAE